MAKVLITGASSGFGRLTAETLAKKGHVVFAGMRDTKGRNADAAGSLSAAANAGGGKIHVLDLDVTSDASVRGAVDQAIATAGGLDVAVSNAGFAAMGLSEGYTDEQVRSVFDTNFFGAQRLFRAVLPHMRARGAGLLVSVSTTMTHVTI